MDGPEDEPVAGSLVQARRCVFGRYDPTILLTDRVLGCAEKNCQSQS